MSNARSPREVCSTTIGTKAIVFLSLVSAGLINTDLSDVSAAEDQGRCRFYTDSHQLQAVSRLAQTSIIFRSPSRPSSPETFSWRFSSVFLRFPYLRPPAPSRRSTRLQQPSPWIS